VHTVAAAGGIGASVLDMARWVRLVLRRGELEGGGRLFSDRSYRQLTRRHNVMAPGVTYGLGWMRSHWRGKKQLWHTGGLDGYASLVAILPRENVGLVVLTNVKNTDIHGFVTEEVFSALLDPHAQDAGAATKPTGAATTPEEEPGRYGIPGGFVAELAVEDGSLVFNGPQGKSFPLVHVEGRKYRFGAPAPAGIYVTFKESERYPGVTELVLDAGALAYHLPRMTDEVLAAAAATPGPEELVGSYRRSDGEIAIGRSEGRVALMIPGSIPEPLLAAEGGRFVLDGVDRVSITALRDDGGKIAGIVLDQAGTEIEFELVAGTPLPRISIDRLMAKVARAHGSRHLRQRLVIRSAGHWLNLGVEGEQVVEHDGPGRYVERTTFSALGQEVGSVELQRDADEVRIVQSFGSPRVLTRRQAAAFRIRARLDSHATWKSTFERVEMTRTSMVDDEPVIVIEKTGPSGSKVFDYVSRRSYLVLKRERVLPIGPMDSMVSETLRYHDYRKVGGFMVPYRTEVTGPSGKAVLEVTSVELGP